MWLKLLQITAAVVATLVVFSVNVSASSGGLYVINVTCPSGWQQVQNNCYLFNNNDELTWAEARTECGLQNADLLILSTSVESNWITIQLEEYQTDSWWIGLKYTSTWNWVQYGGDNTLIRWRHEPDNYDEQDCCAINIFGSFSDEYCRSQLGFICSYSIQRGDSCFDGNPQWLLTDKSCFYTSSLINTSMHLNWTDAKKFCTNLVPSKGSQLLSITNPDDLRSLQYFLSSYDTSDVMLPWWTGLNDQLTEGTYVWADGTPANGAYVKWDQAPSSSQSLNQNCGVMYTGGSIDDMSCDKRAHYICEMSALQGYFDLGCGSWIRGGQSCYWLANGKSMPWTKARDSCSRANAHLISINDLDEKIWLQGLSLGPIGFWTGLYRAQNQYGWAWQDQSSVKPELIAWSQEPNDFRGEDCAEIHRDGFYNDRQCGAKVGYICEYPINFGSNCTLGWSQCEQSCYYISPANDSFSVTWYEAQQKCTDLSLSLGYTGYRLAVTDKTEQDCLNQLLLTQPLGAPGYWTDLSDLETEGIWQFSQQNFNNPPNMDVIPWAKEPNSINGTENCGVIYEGGVYNDLNCEALAFYICEKRASTVLSGSNKVSAPAAFAIVITLFSQFVLNNHM